MLNIKNPEADRLARLLARQTGESITEVVIHALKEKLLREQGKHAPIELRESLLTISRRCSALPNQDVRSPDEILDYNDKGLPS